ncbi:MAG: hypothetical protein HYV29_11960 [Ignavibacteriales bacterium]|nr:hypothetical protein [Ignavibacteriales bacterium]
MFYDPIPDPKLLSQGDVLNNFVIPVLQERLAIVRNPPSGHQLNFQINGKEIPLKAIYEKDDLPDAFATNKESLIVDSIKTQVAIISQSCDIDRKPFLTIAVVHPIQNISSQSKRDDLKRWDRVFECFWLPSEGNFAESYIDLSLLFSVHRDVLLPRIVDRVLAMTSDYRYKLKHKFAQFYSRPDE